MENLLLKKIIQDALLEDLPYGDKTTEAIIEPKCQGQGSVYAKEDGLLAGLDAFIQVFRELDSSIKVKAHLHEGQQFKEGDQLLTVKGSLASILKGERLALNLLQRMCGIATLTDAYVREVKNLPTRIVDTRKTTPNLRYLEKEAVKLGGGHNHRYNLSDAVMIKDNHILAAGSISKALNKVKLAIPHTTKIEIEVTNLTELQEALDAKVDIIMLDNMDLGRMKEAVRMTRSHTHGSSTILEASGNMHLSIIRDVAHTGVDVISVGALTHSARALDLSFLLQQ